MEAGESVAIDGVIAVIGEAGADYETLIKAHKESRKSAPKEVKSDAPKTSEPTVSKTEVKILY